ncbi:transcriptional regulator domain-containing protein [Bosea sp. (in: a-proteobacteria)]
MSQDVSRWRSSSSYDYIDHLTAPEIGWEWLRRNEHYQRDYADFSQETPPTTGLVERASQQWGLRFSHRSRAERHRDEHLLAPRGRYRLDHPGLRAAPPLDR